MKGEGVFAKQLQDLFSVAARRAGLGSERFPLSTAHFRRPAGNQLELGLEA
jgi:hypothetical protein